MMSLKTLIQAALGECDICTVQHTVRDKNHAQSPNAKTACTNIQKQLINAIQEYCGLSKLHSDVQALIDECLEQPASEQIELLEHFREQIIAWRSVHNQLGKCKLKKESTWQR